MNCREGLGAAVPLRRDAEQQHADVPGAWARTPASTRSAISRSPGRWRGSSTGWTATGRLAKTILYNLNPAHNEVVATMIGNFQDGATPGKMQFGSALVVPRSEGRHGAATRRPVEPGAAEPVRRHVDRQPVVSVLHAARVLPPHSLQSAWRARWSKGCCPTTWNWSARWSATSATATRRGTSGSTCRG